MNTTSRLLLFPGTIAAPPRRKPSTAAACGQRCLDLSAPTGKPPEYIIAAYAEAVAKLPAGTSLDDAIRAFIEHQPKTTEPKDIEDLVRQLLEERQRLGVSHRWLRTLRQQLAKFAVRFKGHLHHLRAQELAGWLDSLGVSLVTRNNHRAAAAQLIHFAKNQGVLDPGWDEIQKVPKAKPPPIEVEIYQPAQLAALLAARQAAEDRGRTGGTLIPLLVIQAFAGLRHSEASALHWSAIDLVGGHVRLSARIAKTRARRIIPIHPNLSAWLNLYAQPTGPICPLKQTTGALTRAKAAAGLPAHRGQLTNALRASYISMRLAETNDLARVAREAGNSPKIIQEHYLELATPDQATRWFSILPPEGTRDPLFAWANM